MTHFHHKTHFKFDMDAVAIGGPLPLNRQLNGMVYVAMTMIRNGKESRKFDMMKRGEAMKAEAAEQLRIWKNVTQEAHEAWLEVGAE